MNFLATVTEEASTIAVKSLFRVSQKLLINDTQFKL